jgi:kynurenine formamidase
MAWVTSASAIAITTATKGADFATIGGLKKLGTEKIPPMVAHGVLLDMAAHMGVDVVKEGTAFNKAEIDAVAAKQGVEIRPGDVVIFHTGWLSRSRRTRSVTVRLSPASAAKVRYLVSKGVGADTRASRRFHSRRKATRTDRSLACTRSCCR